MKLSCVSFVSFYKLTYSSTTNESRRKSLSITLVQKRQSLGVLGCSWVGGRKVQEVKHIPWSPDSSNGCYGLRRIPVVVFCFQVYWRKNYEIFTNFGKEHFVTSAADDLDISLPDDWIVHITTSWRSVIRVVWALSSCRQTPVPMSRITSALRTSHATPLFSQFRFPRVRHAHILSYCEQICASRGQTGQNLFTVLCPNKNRKLCNSEQRLEWGQPKKRLMSLCNMVASHDLLSYIQ